MDTKLVNIQRLLCVVFFLILPFLGVSQSLGTTKSKRFEIGVFYPVILKSESSNSFNKFYEGLIGLDAKYTFKKFPFINLKIGASFDYFDLSEDSNILKGSSFRCNPNLLVGFDLSKVLGLEPYLGIGYTIFFNNSKISDSSNVIDPDSPYFSTVNNSETDSNVFYRLGITYTFPKLIYIDVNTYMAKLFENDRFNLNQEQIILNLGVGLYF